MKRIILSIVWGLLTGWAAVPCLWAQSRTGTADREIWVKLLYAWPIPYSVTWPMKH